MTDYELMPVEATPEMEQAAEKYWYERKFKALSDDPRTWKGVYAAMRSAAPAVQEEPVVEPFAWVAVSPCGEMSEMQSTEQCARDLADDWNKELHTLHSGPACHVRPLYTAPQLAVTVPEIIEAVANFVGSQEGGPFPPAVIKAAIIGQLEYGDAFTKLFTSPASQPAEQQPLKSSLALDAATHLTNWLDMNWCECEGGHTCGYNDVKQTRDALLVAAEQHPDDAAVDRFAAAMKAKLNKKRQQGRGGWQSMTAEQLSALLHEHVRKGDPVDVGNLAMMLHQNGQGIKQKPAPVVQGEPVGWQFYQDGIWWNGNDRIKDYRKNTEEAGFLVRDVYATPQPVDGSTTKAAGDRLEREILTVPLPEPTDSVVSALVEALTALRGCITETCGPDAHSALELADAALAAYRKGNKEEPSHDNQ